MTKYKTPQRRRRLVDKSNKVFFSAVSWTFPTQTFPTSCLSEKGNYFLQGVDIIISYLGPSGVTEFMHFCKILDTV